ncbi:hypothetical protein BZA70DRAFT_282221 [Myxozyma melibiosi]|uniref:Zn(2)-C6 fungal-type domain-containing protein n=1 Tax=Myxozyma melibiosi TaxID=54550 RepID=A0ABR1F1X6_9ASCO
MLSYTAVPASSSSSSSSASSSSSRLHQLELIDSVPRSPAASATQESSTAQSTSSASSSTSYTSPSTSSASSASSASASASKAVVRRKSHRKSKTGCVTCRQRRVKCDEQLPVCANCIRHKVRCDYADLSSDAIRDRHLAQIVEHIIDRLTAKSIASLRPFASTRPFEGLSNTDMRLLQHVSICASKFVAVRPEHGLIWKEVAVQAAQREPFLLHAFLAVASAHASHLVKSDELFRLSLEHKTVALRGAQNAISVFSRSDAENVLATSLLLSWQSFYTEDLDPTGGALFASLSAGIETVLDAMGRWRDEFPLASLYYYSTHCEFSPSPLDSPADRLTVFAHLRAAIAGLEPLVYKAPAPASKFHNRRMCFEALRTAVDGLIGHLESGKFDGYAHHEKIALTEVFTRWQLLFAPLEAGESSSSSSSSSPPTATNAPSPTASASSDASSGSSGTSATTCSPSSSPSSSTVAGQTPSAPSASSALVYHCHGDTPTSNKIMEAYSQDAATRIVFAYYYCVGILLHGFYPRLRRTKSFISRLGPLESIIWSLKQHEDWWHEVEPYGYFAQRAIDCYKVRSWGPVLDLEAEVELPERVAEVLWYGMTESKILNSFANFSALL